jgi:D-beta-D-heptose 7-phosphate kinase/D-beta-D-heptose 1-phosphate adenosyltransferase
MSAPTVLIWGDIMLDETWTGEAGRLSPEAPVPVLKPDAEHIHLGGAGNTARNLQALGCKVFLWGAVGKDSAGEHILRALDDLGIHREGVVSLGDRPTTRKLRLRTNTQQLLRLDWETQQPVLWSEAELTQLVRCALACDVVICSDYAKGVLTAGALAFVLRALGQEKKCVIVDPKGNDFTRYAGATLLTPNSKELSMATGMDVGSSTGCHAAVDFLRQQIDVPHFLVTRSQDGMILYEAGKSPHALVATARSVFDVSGAGDTVVAVMAYALGQGLALRQATQMANAAAGVVVSKRGTAVITLDELGFFSERASTESSVLCSHRLGRKTMSLSEAVVWRNFAKAQRKKVVFTNGCFDILHAGHVHCLAAARQEGDLLIVGLNSDVSIRRLKGELRPLVPEQDRIVVLAALAVVDAVVLFDEDTPADLIAALLPDVLVKGDDYLPTQIAGYDVVIQHGGRVATVPKFANRSTTGLVDRILERYDGSTYS